VSGFQISRFDLEDIGRGNVKAKAYGTIRLSGDNVAADFHVPLLPAELNQLDAIAKTIIDRIKARLERELKKAD
jgi:hypothetical protein